MIVKNINITRATFTSISTSALSNEIYYISKHRYTGVWSVERERGAQVYILDVHITSPSPPNAPSVKILFALIAPSYVSQS